MNIPIVDLNCKYEKGNKIGIIVVFQIILYVYKNSIFLSFTFLQQIPANAFSTLELETPISTNMEPREAYFNGSSYLRLLTPMPMWKHSAFSLRSCQGTDIFTIA